MALSVGRHFPSQLLTPARRWRSPGVHVSGAGALCELGPLPRDAAQPFPFPAPRLLRAPHPSQRLRIHCGHAAGTGTEVRSGPAAIESPAPAASGAASPQRCRQGAGAPACLCAEGSDGNATLRSAAVEGWFGVFSPLPPLIPEQGEGMFAVDSFCFI